MGNTTRGMAFRTIAIVLIGTAIGSVLLESGNVASRLLGLPGSQAHVFNAVFLTVGVIGIMLALYLGYRHSRKSD